MQYRAWFRQSQIDGPVVANRFTSEPNEPYLPVFFAYAVGKVSAWTGQPPEYVYAYTGTVLAFVLTLLLFLVVRRFVLDRQQAWWIFLALLVGGGAGAHLKFLTRFESVKANPVVRQTIFDPLQQWLVFEDFRGQYVFTTLFDPHFLLLWCLAVSCVWAFHATLVRFSVARLATTVFLFAGATLVHLYEGITLIAITGGITLVCWGKRIAVRPAVISFIATTLAIAACLVWIAWLVAGSGLPAPTWRGPVILPTILFLAYPLAWGLIAMGGARFWRDADLDGCVLLGWALGCTLLTLSGPFYPYPARGTLTLQIPITIMAGLIYFRRQPRMTAPAVAVAVFLLAATPAWLVSRTALNLRFDAAKPVLFLSEPHRQVIRALALHAGPDDVLLAAPAPLLWLAPEYRGRHYCGHFFLTVDFDRKTREVTRFFAEGPEERAAFMQEKAIRFLYVDAAQEPTKFESVPGLTVVAATSVGTLFEFTADTGSEMHR